MGLCIQSLLSVTNTVVCPCIGFTHSLAGKTVFKSLTNVTVSCGSLFNYPVALPHQGLRLCSRLQHNKVTRHCGLRELAEIGGVPHKGRVGSEYAQLFQGTLLPFETEFSVLINVLQNSSLTKGRRFAELILLQPVSHLLLHK